MIIQVSHEVLEFTARAANGMSPKIPSIYDLSKNNYYKDNFNAKITFMTYWENKFSQTDCH